jgi:CRISPR-associated protein Csh1
MIEAIREIGLYALKKEGKSTDEPLGVLVDNPSNRNTKNIMFISFNKENGEYVYQGIELEEFDSEKLHLYLYRKGSARGTDLTPTAMVTNPINTFRQKISGWFKDYAQSEDERLFSNIGKCIEENKAQIEMELQEKYSNENNIISLKIDGKYLGDIEEFKDKLIDKAKVDYYYKSSFTTGKESIAEDRLCAVCKKNKAEVYGFVSTFKFYTVDKPGFVSGGFRQSNAWKNYPVCLECALILEEGKKYLGKQFNFNFYGTKYLLIPKFLINASDEEKKKVFRVFDGEPDPRFLREEVKRLTNDENEALYFLSKFQNYLNLNFLFYSAPKGFEGAVFNVLHYIEDILPSRIKQLFEAKKEIDKKIIFKEHLIPIYENQRRVGEKPLEFNFGILRNFFYNSEERNPISDSYFLETTNRIFSSRAVDYDFILGFIVNKLRSDFVNSYSTQTDALKGFMLLLFLKKLGLINITKGDKKMNETFFNSDGEIKEKVDKFFNEFEDFFNLPEKRAVFLEGVLAQFLLNIQWLDRGVQPFRARLKGLKMNESIIKKLLPEIQNKLEEYGKNYYGQLEEIISGYFVQAGDNWQLSNDEISFYFTLGMNLSKNFKSEKENKEGENNE